MCWKPSRSPLLQAEGPFLHFLHGARHPVPRGPATVHSAAFRQRSSWATW